MNEDILSLLPKPVASSESPTAGGLPSDETRVRPPLATSVQAQPPVSTAPGISPPVSTTAKAQVKPPATATSSTTTVGTPQTIEQKLQSAQLGGPSAEVTDLLTQLKGLLQTPVQTTSQGMTDTLSQLKQLMGAPVQTTSQGMTDALSQLKQLMGTPMQDVTASQDYKTIKTSLEQQGAQVAKDSTRRILEEMNARGILPSTITGDEAVELENKIAQGITQQLASLIPTLRSQQLQERQAGIQNVASLFGIESGLVDRETARQQQQIQNIATLYGFESDIVEKAAAGQQQQMQNMTTLLDTLQRSDENAYNKLKDAYSIEIDKQTAAAEAKQQKLDNALARTEQFGFVPAADAPIIGVPAGTPSNAAKQAAANRQQEIDINKYNAKQAMDRLNKQIAADKQARAQASAERAAERAQDEAKKQAELEQKAGYNDDFNATWDAFYNYFDQSPEMADQFLKLNRTGIIQNLGQKVYDDMYEDYRSRTKQSPGDALSEALKTILTE